ncbi:helix-turn-helix domain-containing protein, partial [Ewingella sp. S1.OA.A_B6]
MSRKTGYKWLKRFQPDDPLSLTDRSRARLTHPERTPDGIIKKLVDMRLKHPDWGPVKIRHWLLNNNAPFDVPASSS